MEIILASLSPRRATLLGEWEIPFRVVAPEGVDESSATGTPGEVAAELAVRKAASVVSGILQAGGAPRDLLVIGADTVVELEGELLGKPADRSHARSILEHLAGRTHRVITGVSVQRPGGPRLVELEATEVTFRSLSSGEIEEYLATGDAMGKAGAYGIQSEGRRLVEGFRGCYYNIVGLPMRRLLGMIAACRAGGQGISIPTCDCADHPLWRGGIGCRPDGSRSREE